MRRSTVSPGGSLTECFLENWIIRATALVLEPILQGRLARAAASTSSTDLNCPREICCRIRHPDLARGFWRKVEFRLIRNIAPLRSRLG